MPRTRDVAWTQFTRDPERNGIVICKLCQSKISLGPNPRNQSIGAAKRHLESQHKQVYLSLYKSAENSSKETQISGKKRRKLKKLKKFVATNPQTQCFSEGKSTESKL